MNKQNLKTVIELATNDIQHCAKYWRGDLFTRDHKSTLEEIAIDLSEAIKLLEDNKS